MTFQDSWINRLFEDYQAQLFRYALGLVHDSDQAEDLVQETLIRASTHRETLARLTDAERRAWLFAVIRNRFIDQYRRYRRQQRLLAGLADLLSSEGRGLNYAGEVNLFSCVPEQYRRLLIQRYVYGLTSEEIAGELHIPAATVRSRIRLAIQWLRAHMDEWI